VKCAEEGVEVEGAHRGEVMGEGVTGSRRCLYCVCLYIYGVVFCIRVRGAVVLKY